MAAKKTPGLRKHRPEKPAGDYQFRSMTRSIIYTNWAKRFVHDNPGIIWDFLSARKRILNGETEVKSGNIAVTHLIRKGDVHAFLYKVTIGSNRFFVKEQWKGKNRQSFMPEWDLAEPQINALKKADEIIKGAGISDVEVAKWHLGWTNGESSFLVTDFYNGHLVDETPNTPQKLLKKLKEVRRIFKENNVGDFKEHNAMWCPETGKIIFFDLRSL